MLKAGFLLSDVPRRVSWRAVYGLLESAQAGTALALCLDDVDAGGLWTPELYRLTSVLDMLHVLAWQNTGKKSNKPKPIPRPGETKNDHWGKGALPLEDMKDWLGWEDELSRE